MISSSRAYCRTRVTNLKVGGSSQVSRAVWRAGEVSQGVDAVATETAVALVYNGISHVVMMATPADLEDFALGFSLSEGIVNSPKQMLDFDFVLQSVVEECRPNLLCNYLYELACQFAQFYEACPVLKAEETQRGTRLALCDLVSRVLKQGLEALGLETTDRM